MDLLNLCLTLKDFQYNGKQCKQLNGNSYGLSSFCCCSRNRYAKHQNIEEQSLATYRRTIAAQSRHRRKPSFMLFLYSGIWWSRWIVPRAFRTFHDQSPVHIRILTMFTGNFGVTGGGRFMTITFCFLTVVFSVVVALSGVFSFTAILRSHFLLLLIFNIRWTLLIITLALGSIFYISVAFPPSINSLSNFLFLIKPLSIPNSASPSRNIFSARGLVTSLLWGSNT